MEMLFFASNIIFYNETNNRFNSLWLMVTIYILITTSTTLQGFFSMQIKATKAVSKVIAQRQAMFRFQLLLALTEIGQSALISFQFC